VRRSKASTYFSRVLVTTSSGSEGTGLIVRASDGEFRRLLATENGHNVVAADGAEPLLVEKHGVDSLYVTADSITYRLPVPVGS